MVQEDRSRWYQRMENNSWRLFCSRVVPISEPVEIGANKKTDFHYSKLQRKQDLESWKKRRKIEWMWHMYNQGRLQNNPGWRDVVSLVRDVAQEVTDTSEEKEDNEIEERELEELLIWTTTLNFEEYMQEWNCLARSPSSVLSKEHPGTPLSAQRQRTCSRPLSTGTVWCPGLTAERCKELLPSHPLELSEKNFQLNQDKMNFSTLRNIQGLHAPLKLQMEYRAARQIQRLPFLQSSNLALDTLRGSDECIGFEDILNDPAQSEVMGEPHMMVEYKMGLL
ncbi:hypothetical protein INR49_021160 [Caranx melampygus]|nr:hypothetical protein INR49_021160 [Caranx melampygus]